MKLVKFKQFDGDTIYINPEHVCMVVAAETTSNAVHVHLISDDSAFRGYGIWVEGTIDAVVSKLQSVVIPPIDGRVYE